MAKPKGLTLEVNNVSQTFDVEELTGRKLTQSQTRQLGDLFLEAIEVRTLSGVDRAGKEFTRYSKEYAAGKGVQRDQVDMVLKGDMLGSMDKRATRAGELVIHHKGKLQNNKAHGHNTGGGNLPRREYFGLTKAQASKIAKDYVSTLPKEEAKKDEKLSAGQIKELVDSITLERLPED